MKKILAIVITALLLFLSIGCKEQRPQDVSEQKTNSDGLLTLEELYSEVDLSQYSAYGSSTENKVMWVEKSNYAGKMYGCINTNGEYIVPLTSEIKEISNYDFSPEGFSVVIFNPSKRVDTAYGVEYEREFGAIYNLKGEIVNKFELVGISSWRYLNNGNIFFENIDPYGTLSHSSSNAYMFCIKTGELVEMPIPAGQSSSTIEYSDDLMLIYSNYYKNPGAKYYDHDGNCCIDLDNSNEYYKEVMYADNFINGQANVNFIGLDGNWYKVKIDKKGEWITEPKQISKYDAETFSGSY